MSSEPAEEKINLNEGEPKGIDNSIALNNKAFLEFLAKFPDAVRVEDVSEEDIARRFEVFKVKEVVKKEISTVIGTEISKTFGLKLEKADYKSVDDFLEKKAIEDPDAILTISSQVKTFRELPKAIEKAEAEVKALSIRMQKMREETPLAEKSLDMHENALKDMGTLNYLKNRGTTLGSRFKDFFNASREPDVKVFKAVDVINARRELESKVGVLNPVAIRKEIDDLRKKVEEIKKTEGDISTNSQVLKEAKENIAILQETVMRMFTVDMGMNEVMKLKITERLSGTDGGLAGVQARTRDLGKFKQIQETGEWDNLFSLPVEDFEKGLDNLADKQIVEAVDGAVKGLKMESGQFTILERSIMDILKNETLGTKEKEAIKEKVTELLQQNLELLVDPADVPKKFIIMSLIRKINK